MDASTAWIALGIIVGAAFILPITWLMLFMFRNKKAVMNCHVGVIYDWNRSAKPYLMEKTAGNKAKPPQRFRKKGATGEYHILPEASADTLWPWCNFIPDAFKASIMMSCYRWDDPNPWHPYGQPFPEQTARMMQLGQEEAHAAGFMGDVDRNTQGVGGGLKLKGWSLLAIVGSVVLLVVVGIVTFLTYARVNAGFSAWGA